MANPTLYDTTKQQHAIGPELSSHRFLAKGWNNAMKQGGAEQLEHTMTHIQHVLWSTLMKPIWKMRYKIQHRKYNIAETEKGIWLGGQIQ